MLHVIHTTVDFQMCEVFSFWFLFSSFGFCGSGFGWIYNERRKKGEEKKQKEEKEEKEEREQERSLTATLYVETNDQQTSYCSQKIKNKQSTSAEFLVYQIH